MRCFQNIDIEIVIHKDRTTHRCDSDCIFSDLKIVDGICDEPVSNPVVTPGAEMVGNIDQAFRTFKNKLHFLTPKFKCQNPCLRQAGETNPKF
jgi:hypothetical protein